MRLAPRETVPAAAPAQTPERVEPWASICAVLTLLPAFRPAGPRGSLRCVPGVRRSSLTILRAAALLSRDAPAQAVTPPAALRPAKVSRSVAQPPRISGEASRWPSWKVPPRWRSPPLNGRGAWVGGEKGISLAARRLRSPALRTAGLLAGFSAPLGHEQGKGFVGGILERASL